MREIFALRRPRVHSSVGVVGGGGGGQGRASSNSKLQLTCLWGTGFRVRQPSYETVYFRITMSSDSRVQGLGESSSMPGRWHVSWLNIIGGPMISQILL